MRNWTIHGLLLENIRMWAVVLMTVVMVISSGAADPLYSITTPTHYVVFSGDLDFNYTIPGNVALPHAFVRLEIQQKDQKEALEITTMGLMIGRKHGNLRVACGVIEFAGTYTLKMYARDKGRLLASANLHVKWPEVSLSLPDQHKAQTSKVELRIISRATCTSRLSRHFLQIKLYFQRRDLQGRTLVFSKADLISAQDFSSINKTFSTIAFGCHLFDLDGFYQAVLESNAPDSPVIAISNVMNVSWSDGYYLSVRTKSAFPCQNSVKVIYTHPPCSGVDKMRLYSFKPVAQGSPASPMTRTYVTETIADPDKTEMAYDCKLFDQAASGFCFIYVSVTRVDVVSEQKRLCIPAQADSVFPIDGGWGAWTAWTECSVTCGTGKRNRFRICNEPPPKHGGRFCEGDPVKWMPCERHCPESIPRTPLHSPKINPSCACGCTKNEDSGEIIATGRCSGMSVWIIKSQEGNVIALRFDYFSLNYTRQWVKIRDGVDASNTLLFSSTNKGYPVEILTTGPAMRVEFMTTYISPPPVAIFPKNATLPIHAHGFIASYNFRANVMSSTATVLYQYEEETIMNSTITIVGIAICAVVIAVAIIFVIVQRTFFRRRVKYTMATSDSPAHNMTASGSGHPGSSGHSSSPSSPGNVIHVDLDVPLTGKIPRKASGAKISRASSASSTSSQRHKKAKSKGESTPHGKDTKSPKTGKKECTPLTSPYGIEIIDTDQVEGQVKGSPKIKIKTPKSPRGHSSSHRKSPVTPISPITKLDLLNKKRHTLEKKGQGVTADLDRQITGSSGSSTQRSRSPSSTKAEINWPQGSFVKSAFNEVGKTFSDRNKRSGHRPPSEEIPLIDSMTSSQESPTHIFNMAKSDSIDSATTSFVRPASTKLRRPTSLTESYSNDSESKSNLKPDSQTPTGESEAAVIETESTTHSVGKPVQLPPSSSLPPPPKFVYYKPSSSTAASSSKANQLVKPLSSQTLPSNNANSNKINKTAYEERQSLLPKPDGQSPKLQRHDSPGTTSNKEQVSPGKASKASSLGSKNTVSSPARSVTTPSEIEGLELEYDDFIEDDPLSYFDYEETQKLAFRGVEKIGKTPVEEEEEDEL